MATLKHLAVDAPTHDIIAEIEENGAVIIDGFLSRDVLDRFNSEINSHIDDKVPNHGHPNKGMEYFHGAQTKHVTGVAGISDTFVHEVPAASHLQGGRRSPTGRVRHMEKSS